ncbi:DNA helicase-2/ATP-dependent DNA helicase PcrA [Lachnotalea glycerini]|uniref:DNA 3'-5' helicase n=1 Tax=Lachnotalea glycerini TaxID=1763509 RepID=A0A318EIN0_9FIRM|nr:3'-5' exonuclease [Lachnotalea glycerini]PXV86886.1 DNA helicase-2/ATP-dependent DNA helicase PcrA [Lachnotalea glycerini]
MIQEKTISKNEIKKQKVTSEASFPDEAFHLVDINGKLEDAIQKANVSVEKYDGDYKKTKLYMVENRGEIDPHEMFQNELLLKQIDQIGAFSVTILDKLMKLQDSPYFARIDFREENEKQAMATYIGKFSFTYDNELLISDWRSPVASMFYDFDVGPASYDAPIGKVSGSLKRKRQFKIKNGELNYVLESSTNIQDDILQQELSHTSDEKMKSIITTIQKEQNLIIRNENAQTLIIQGVAGSGKTSVALHRIAFLLYRFKDRLSAQNIVILSPNKVFGDYISNVLPELGEEPIYELSFSDIARVQLEGVIDFEEEKNPLETNDKQWVKRACYKTTLEFVQTMDSYLEQVNETIFEATDFSVKEFFVAKEWIEKRFHSCKDYPIKQRLQIIADNIYHRLEADNPMDEPVPKPKTVLKSLNSMLQIKSTLALYKDFYIRMGIKDLFVMPAKNTLEWSDVYPFLYFHARLQGLKQSKLIRHLVVDEMQDYTPIQYAVLNIIFACPKTILGDYGQLINPNHQHTLKQLCQIYHGAELILLNKSYRSTYEIINFAKQVQNDSSIDVIERHGEKPSIFYCQTKQEETKQIKKQIKSFKQSKYATLGIILKTNDNAKMLYDELSKDYEVSLITPDSTAFQNGIIITSIQMSKGLEFDEVLIVSVNQNEYHTSFDRSLLYIACTRAMHLLNLTCVGEPSSLLPDSM